MIRAFSILIFSLLLSLPVVAQDSGLRRMDTGVQAQGFEAVGRLELNGKGFCSGALIAPDLVLTAAHCLYDKISGQRLDASQLEFRAGWRNGRAEAYRNIRRAMAHPDYRFGATQGAERVINDLAILQLHHPIRNTTVIPFETTQGLSGGAQVGVVSYAADRSAAPSFQEMCTVIGQQRGVYVLSCNVDYGSSGAPVFAFDGAKARIVSVVSAKASYEDKPVALAVALDGPLDLLMAEFRKEPTVRVNRLGGGEGRNSTGAKFIKPGGG